MADWLSNVQKANNLPSGSNASSGSAPRQNDWLTSVSSGASSANSYKPNQLTSSIAPEPQPAAQPTTFQKIASQAKKLPGFGSVANTINAFKREFGESTKLVPSQVKQAGGVIAQSWVQQNRALNSFLASNSKILNVVRKGSPAVDNALAVWGVMSNVPGAQEAGRRINTEVENRGSQLREQGFQKQSEIMQESQANRPQYEGAAKWGAMVGGTIPQLLTTMTLTAATAIATKNPAAATAVGLSTSFGFGASEVYTRAREFGLSDAEALPLAQIGGTIIGAVDFLPIGDFVTSTPAGQAVKKSLVKNLVDLVGGTLLRGGVEGVTESFQELIGNALAQTYDENQSLIEGTKDAFIGGILTMGFVDLTLGRVFRGVNKDETPQEIEQAVSEKLEEAITTDPQERTPEQQQVAEAALTQELTPGDAIKYVTESSQENTPDGREIVKMAAQAQQTGQNILVEPDDQNTGIQASLVEPGTLEIRVRDLNRPMNQANTEKTTTQTLEGQRETYRLNSPENIERFSNVESLGTTDPDAEVNVYRWTDSDAGIEPGQYVGLNEQALEKYKQRSPGENFRVVSSKVKVSDLVGGGGLRIEAIYAPETSVSQAEQQKTVANDKPDKVETNTEDLNNQLRDYYKRELETEDSDVAALLNEMDAAQAGQRIFDNEQNAIGGQDSTFPSWIPEELRDRKLFDSVLDGFRNPDTLTFPPNSQPRKQALYEEILGGSDEGSALIKQIKESYDQGQKPTTKRPSSKPASKADPSPRGSQEADASLDQEIAQYIDKRGAVKFREQAFERTYNLADPEDLEYLSRIFSESQLEDFKIGYYGNRTLEGVENIIKGNLVNEKVDRQKNQINSEELVERAIEMYGTTNVPESIGFITVDGRGIDSSGKKLGSSSEGRSIDHRQIAQDSFPEDATFSGTTALNEFMERTGSVRIKQAGKNGLNIDIVVYPTESQWKKIEDLADKSPIIYADISKTNGDVLKSGNFKTFAEYRKFVDKNLSKEKFRVKDDVESFTGQKITDEQEAEIIALNKRIFGDENVKITLQIMANTKALGSSKDGIITIVDGQADPKDTFYHEAVHKYLDVFTTREEQTALLKAGVEKYGTRDLMQVEERIAEDFISYAKSREGFTGSIKQLIDRVLSRIKAYFSNQSEIDSLYQSILAPKKSAPTTDTPSNPKTEDIPRKKGYSRFQERLEEQLLDSNQEKYNWDDTKRTYDQISLKRDAEKADKLLEKDPERAMSIARGFEDPKANDPVYFDILQAVALKAFDEGNVALGKEMINKVTLTATRYGQNNASLRGNFNNNTPQNFIKQIISARMERLGGTKLAEVDKLIGRKQSAKTRATAQIDIEVEKIRKLVNKKTRLKQDKIKLAQSIIDSLKCT